MTPQNSPLRLVILGHVDHGKSTLIGRLMHDTGSLPEGKKEAIEKSCRQRGQPFEWAFLMDALQAERDQNVTIETTQIWLKGKKRGTMIIDAPGHAEFLRNMVTGAAQADAALLVVSATEGMGAQSRTHAALMQLLGVRQAAVLVNKMDAVGYRQPAFRKVENEYRKYLKTLGITPAFVIPVSAREGDNIVQASPRMRWYKGKTVLKALDTFKTATPAGRKPLRFPVQDVYKSENKRIVAGRIESGALNTGDTLLFLPAGTSAKVYSIEAWKKKPRRKAVAGESIGITLDRPIFVERGQMASHEKNAPILTNLFSARLFWLGKKPLKAGDAAQLMIGTLETPAEIKSIGAVEKVGYGGAAEVMLKTRGQVAVDDGSRFVLKQNHAIIAGGVVNAKELFDQRPLRAAVKSKHITPEHFGITRQARARKNRHEGGILWLTGLSGAGKSTIARLTQQKLFDKGCQVFVLDGDNIRCGLSRDLGFSAADRHENLRRVAEVAALFVEAGMIVITAFISPYEKDRELARAAAPDDLHLVYVKASLKTCEKRDAKGLYKKARAGKIPHFTGISAPYEDPKAPDLVLDTEKKSPEANAETLVAYITGHLIKQQA